VARKLIKLISSQIVKDTWMA